MRRLVPLEVGDALGPAGGAVAVPGEAHGRELGLPLVAEGVPLALVVLLAVQLPLLVDPRGQGLRLPPPDGDVAVAVLLAEGLEVGDAVVPGTLGPQAPGEADGFQGGLPLGRQGRRDALVLLGLLGPLIPGPLAERILLGQVEVPRLLPEGLEALEVVEPRLRPLRRAGLGRGVLEQVGVGDRVDLHPLVVLAAVAEARPLRGGDVDVGLGLGLRVEAGDHLARGHVVGDRGGDGAHVGIVRMGRCRAGSGSSASQGRHLDGRSGGGGHPGRLQNLLLPGALA